MKNSCDVVIIGAGPYGLSLAAHLAAMKIDFRIFGKPLDTWRHHMPKDMLLKSDGFASNISAPGEAHTLKTYCAERGIAYGDHGLPVSLDLFNAYAGEFQKKVVPQVEEKMVSGVARNGDGFIVELDSGEKFGAKTVVMAVGVTWFAHMAQQLSGFPDWAVSHSYDHRDVSQFKDRDVAVLGAGASAIDLAALLHDSGANVQVIARADHVRFHSAPDPQDHSFLRMVQRPPTGIGPGWRSFFCANTPLLFHRLPENMRLRATRNHLGPAPGWFMRQRVEGKVAMLLGHDVKSAAAKGDRVELELASESGTRSVANFDHVISATGYRPDLMKLPFLSMSLLSEVAMVENTPILSDQFETTSSGFYVTGPAAANSFGPLMRFMVGAEFVAPRMAAHLARRLGAQRFAKAA